MAVRPRADAIFRYRLRKALPGTQLPPVKASPTIPPTGRIPPESLEAGMTTRHPSRRAATRLLRDLVHDRSSDDFVSELQDGYLRDTSTAVGRLAQLRRGAGKLPQDVPELWGLTGAERLYQEQFAQRGPGDPAEAAAFLAVTLYALHQQSRPNQGMHCPASNSGAAVRRLMPPGEIDEPIRRRFVRVGTASSPESLAYRLREIISLLRRDSIPLDYALLAEQLYQAHARRVCAGPPAMGPQLPRLPSAPRNGDQAQPAHADQPDGTPPGEATTDKDVT